MDNYKKGGKVKKQRKKPIKKGLKKGLNVRKRRPKLQQVSTKDKIITQPAFEMFGYRVPPMQAPGKPIDEQAYSKISELLKKAEEERALTEKKRKEMEELKGSQMIPSGSSAISPDYDEIRRQMSDFDRRQRALEDLAGQYNEVKIDPVEFTKKGEVKKKQSFKGGAVVIDSGEKRGRKPKTKKESINQEAPKPNEESFKDVMLKKQSEITELDNEIRRLNDEYIDLSVLPQTEKRIKIMDDMSKRIDELEKQRRMMV